MCFAIRSFSSGERNIQISMTEESQDSISLEVIRRLQEEMECSMDDFCLYHFIDPEALDALFSSRNEESILVVNFEVEDYLVTIDSGDVCIENCSSV